MKFQISIEGANTLYEFAKRMKINKNWQDEFRLIQCEIAGDILTAEFITGASCTRFCYPVHGAESADGTFYILPPSKKFTKSDVAVTIENDDRCTTYTTARGASIERKGSPELPQKFNLDNFFTREEPKAGVWVDPKKLAAILECYDIPGVRIEFLSERNGIIIHTKDGNTKTLLMPMCVN